MNYVCRWEWDKHDGGDEPGMPFDNPEEAAYDFIEKNFHDISYHGKPLHVVARDEMGAEFQFKATVEWDPSFYLEEEKKEAKR